MTDPITYLLPFPPSFNRAWRAVGGRVLLAESVRKYHVAVSNALPSGRVVPLDGRLSVDIVLAPPIKQRGEWDVDNRLKALFDALTRAKVWRDDKQIDKIRASRVGAQFGTPAGYALITIHQLHAANS